jgi:hypothetical protein
MSATENNRMPSRSVDNGVQSMICARTLLLVVMAWCVVGTASAADVVALPGTGPLTMERPLDEVMVEGLHRFCLRELAASPQRRTARWMPDGSRGPLDAEDLASRRERFRSLIGAVDPRLTADPSRAIPV